MNGRLEDAENRLVCQVSAAVAAKAAFLPPAIAAAVAGGLAGLLARTKGLSGVYHSDRRKGETTPSDPTEPLV